MSRYFSERYASLKPYVPGEQPQDRQYVKLNTNESPFPPSEAAIAYANENARSYELYSDIEAVLLREELAKTYHVPPECIMVSDGSDEMLNFAFLAFGSEARPAVFPDITYGFYRVYADIDRIPYREIPLEDDLTIDLKRYEGQKAVIFLANPNAPIGIALEPEEIERLARRSPESVIVVDEAYVDFGARSCVPLIQRLNNLLVVQTFSKSRSLAGARLGFAIGCPDLMRDMQTIRYSLNPYNVNSFTLALGIGVLRDAETVRSNCEAIIKNRAYLTEGLKAMGFVCTPSMANFVFARHLRLNGRLLYEMLKDRGVLVRHFDQSRIRQYNRITVGTIEQIDRLLQETARILNE